jgi:hypothetical protein
MGDTGAMLEAIAYDILWQEHLPKDPIAILTTGKLLRTELLGQTVYSTSQVSKYSCTVD